MDDRKKDYKKLEMHVHSMPASVCSRLSPEAIAQKYAAMNYGAIVLTNHYTRSYIEKYGVTHEQWMDMFIQSYRDQCEACKKYGIEVYLGAEVTLYQFSSIYMQERHSAEELWNNYADYLLYGITEDFLRSSPPLGDFTLPALHDHCRAAGVLVVQAHPYRTEQFHSPKDVRYLDGLEINGNGGYASGPHEKEILATAKEHGLIVTCGMDVHYDWTKLTAAAYIPRDIHDSVALAEHLRKVRVVDYKLGIHDPNPLPTPEEWLRRYPDCPER